MHHHNKIGVINVNQLKHGYKSNHMALNYNKNLLF